jgi:hypothetical protein
MGGECLERSATTSKIVRQPDQGQQVAPPSQRRPMVLATAQVVPVPRKGSSTTSPMNVYSPISLPSNFSGSAARCPRARFTFCGTSTKLVALDRGGVGSGSHSPL